MNQDIRWKQRYANFLKAYTQLTEFIDKGTLNKFEQQGLIQCFEYTYELSWNVLKDYLEADGNQNITGSRSAIKEAFKVGLIKDGEGWMKMFQDRNQTSHTYNEATADEIIAHIYSNSYPLFNAFKQTFDNLL